MVETPAILVVDDDAVNRSIAAIVLAAAGWRVETVENGAAAVAAAAAGGYALVLMDIQMPGMDGYDAALAIRAGSAAGAALPIVAFTALRREEMDGRFERAGMDGHIAKPFTPEELAAAVEPWRPSADVRAIERLATIFGADEMAGLLQRFGGQLHEALDAGDDREILRARAHKIAGIAGTLGFQEVSRAWLAVSEGADSAWEGARIAARKALLLLAEDRELTPGHPNLA